MKTSALKIEIEGIGFNIGTRFTHASLVQFVTFVREAAYAIMCSSMGEAGMTYDNTCGEWVHSWGGGGHMV
jgi:hypothetical protein